MTKRSIYLLIAFVMLFVIAGGIYLFGDQLSLAIGTSDASPVIEDAGSGDDAGNNYASWGFIAGGFGY